MAPGHRNRAERRGVAAPPRVLGLRPGRLELVVPLVHLGRVRHAARRHMGRRPRLVCSRRADCSRRLEEEPAHASAHVREAGRGGARRPVGRPRPARRHRHARGPQNARRRLGASQDAQPRGLIWKMITQNLFLFLLLFSYCSADLECLDATDQISIPGAGATFPQVSYSEWMFAYEISPKGEETEICYRSCGSGCGKECIINGTDPNGDPCPVTFGASDSFLSSSNYARVPDLQMYPMLAGAVVPMYNLGSFPQRTELILGREVLVDIFLCEVTNWQDKRIVELNSGPNQLCPGGNVSSPDCQLPNTTIKVYHRSDSSGTTETFTKALYSFSEKWGQEAGLPSSVWPKNVSQKCNQGSSEGNYGTFAFVISQESSITYVSYGVIQNSGVGKYARLINRDNYLVTADSIYVQNAMLKTEWDEVKFRGECIDVGGESWPISAYTYILFRKNQTENNPSWYNCDSTREAIKFFTWALTDSTPITKAENLGFVPLAPILADEVISRMETEIYCDERPAIITFTLPIGVIFPETGLSGGDPLLWKEVILYSSEKLMSYNFTSTTIGLKGWRFDVKFEDSKNSQSESLVKTASLIDSDIKLMIAEFSDLLTNTIQILTGHDSICQLSPQTEYERTSVSGSSSLIRVKPTFLQQSLGLLELINQIGWNEVVVLSTSDVESVNIARYLVEISPKFSIEAQRLILNLSDSNGATPLNSILDSGLRVIISCVPNSDIPKLLEIGYDMGLIKKGYNWLFGLTDISMYSQEIDIFSGVNQNILSQLQGSIYFSLGSEDGDDDYHELLEEIKTGNGEYPELEERAKSGQGLDQYSIILYDLMFTIGWGIHEIIKDMGEFDIQQHTFSELSQVIKDKVFFNGLSGSVSFNDIGDREGEYILNNYQSKANGQMGWVSAGRFWSSSSQLEIQQEVIIFSGGTWINPPPDYIPPEDVIVKLDWDEPVTKVGLALTIIGEILVLYFLIEIQHFQGRKIIRAASVFFLRLVLFGASIGFASNFLIVVPPSDPVCILYPWLSWAGFTLVFGGLYSKTFRIWKIFNNPSLKNIKLSNGKVMQTTLITFLTNALLILLWSVIDTPYVTESGEYYEDGKSAEMCTSPHEEVWTALFLIPFFFLLVGLSIVSFLTRNIQSKFNESRHLAIAIYHFTICFIVSVALAIALRNFLEFQSAIRFLGIYIGLFGILMILYVPKFWVCYFDPNSSNTLEVTSNTKGNSSYGSSPKTQKSSYVEEI